MSIKVDNFLAHHGVKGMRWGVRKRQPPTPGSQKARTAAYKANPTKREYLLGVGKTTAERSKSRRRVAVTAISSILASSAADILVNNIPKLAPYKAGVAAFNSGVRLSAGLGAAYAGVAEIVDRSIDRSQKK